MTVLPSSSPLQTVSLAPTSQQINVPLGSGGARAITAGGKLISVSGAGPGSLGGPSGPPTNPPPGVTIQKSTIPVSSPSPRTISLPYGAPTPVVALPKPVSQAIPVARVCPQPNVVTITTTVGNVISSGMYFINSKGQAIIYISMFLPIFDILEPVCYKKRQKKIS